MTHGEIAESAVLMSRVLENDHLVDGDVFDRAAVVAFFCAIGTYAQNAIGASGRPLPASDCFCGGNPDSVSGSGGAFRYGIDALKFVADAVTEKAQRDGCSPGYRPATADEKREARNRAIGLPPGLRINISDDGRIEITGGPTNAFVFKDTP